MIAVLALGIPALITVYLREKILDMDTSWKQRIIAYLISVLALNWLMLFIVNYGFDVKENVFLKLNMYNQFACKYIALSVAIALTEPFLERFIKQKISFEIVTPIHCRKFRYWKFCACLYSIALFTMNFIRIFDNNFWGDEAFTINLVRHSVPEIIRRTAADVHPPLYYLFVKLMFSIAGGQGWAYHLVSLIPCAIIIIFALTVIWKRFGGSVSIIFITLACLSNNAVKYNVEVRMYSWGALFVLLSFYYFYDILNDNRTRSYVLFVISSLAAAYTHYYCLISVVFFYVTLMIYSLLKKENLKKVIIVYAVTIVGYLPWFFIMLQSMLKRVGSYWISTIPTLEESIKYIFSDQFPFWIWILIVILMVIVLFYETGILKISDKHEKRYSIRLDIASARCSSILVWIFAGVLSVFGTVGFGIIISKLVRPFYTLRYIYPVSIIAWLLLGIMVSRLKGKKLYVIIFVLLMLSIFIPDYRKTYTNEKNMNTKLETTLESTTEIAVEDVILTNQSHIEWTIAECYYPGVETSIITLGDIPVLEQNTTYWLIIGGKQELEETFMQIEEQGFAYKQIVDGGNLGTHTVYIYKLEFVH